jgi:hypothetical protein
MSFEAVIVQSGDKARAQEIKAEFFFSVNQCENF